MFITADHGNAEQNIDPTSVLMHTTHTTTPVPAILTDTRYTLAQGSLPDIAPTLLAVMGLHIPPEMTGTARTTPTQE